MDASLYSRCMTPILDGVTAGSLVNFDHVPIIIRQSIFANIQRVVRARDDYLPAALRGGQFFDNFEHIHLLDSIDCSKYFELLSTIVSELDRPESSLRSGLVSLRLKVCFGNFNRSSTNRSIETESDMSRSVAVVCRLIAACRNLRRLDLNLHYHPYEDKNIDSFYRNGDPVHKIAKAIGIEGVVRSPLEQLTLRNVESLSYEHDFSLFDSLEILELNSCKLPVDLWLRLLKRCGRTLRSLTLDNCFFGLTQPAERVELIALKSLNISDSYWYNHDSFWLSAETLGRVQNGRVCLFGYTKPVTFGMIEGRLSPNTEVAYYIERRSDFARLSSARQLFGQRLVELRINSAIQFPEAEELDDMVSSLKSIQVLIMDVDSYDSSDREGGDQFLRRFLSDADRCAKLRWLQIRWSLEQETVRLVFRNCYNLEFLFLVERKRYFNVSEITDEDLTVWAANGAKPKEVYLGLRQTFTVDGVNQLLRNCGDDLKASFLDARRQFIEKNEIIIADRLSDLSWYRCKKPTYE